MAFCCFRYFSLALARGNCQTQQPRKMLSGIGNLVFNLGDIVSRSEVVGLEAVRTKRSQGENAV